jgi:hypothetical protein
MWVWTRLAQLTAPAPEHWEPGNLNSDFELKLPDFSTFAPGAEPDTWPVLESETAAPGVGTAAFGAISGAVAGLLTALGWLRRRRFNGLAAAGFLRWRRVWRALFQLGVRS